jgi:hypothetical protein
VDKEDLRILFAAFAMVGRDWGRYDEDDIGDVTKECWDVADAMIRAKDGRDEGGITTIKKRTRRSSND